MSNLIQEIIDKHVSLSNVRASVGSRNSYYASTLGKLFSDEGPLEKFKRISPGTLRNHIHKVEVRAKVM